jgi:predicted RNA-binding protein (virulence factor B family)
MPAECGKGTLVEVFIYLDSEDRLIATTQKPYVEVGGFELLRTLAVEQVGAFMDWGLSKDLLVPFREQKQKLVAGRSYIVRVYLDEKSGRIAGSTKLDKFLNLDAPPYKGGEEVDLIVARATDMGFVAIVAGSYWGMLYKNEVFQRLDVGQRLQGYIRQVREDGKIDLTLEPAGYAKVDGKSAEIFERIKSSGGFLGLTSKSAPEAIYAELGMSKKNFKMAVGALYKKRLIQIDDDGIRLVK